MRILTASVALAALSGCGGGDCEATANARVHQILDVSWSGKAGDTHVEWGFTEGALDHSTPVLSQDNTRHTAQIVGLPALTDVFYETVIDTGSKEIRCAGTARTENRPSGMPDLTVTVDDAAAKSPEPYVLGAVLGDPQALFVIDRATGEWLWYRVAEHGVATVDVEFAKGGASPPTLWFNEMDGSRQTDIGALVEIGWDGTELERIDAEGLHHVFAQGPDGVLAWLSVEVQDWEDPENGTIPVVGDTIREIDTAGNETVVFDTWDQWEPVRTEAWDTDFYPQGEDWTHANSIHYNADVDSWLVSFDNIKEVVEIDRPTGEITRSFGPLDGSYAFADGSMEFSHQHDAWYDAGAAHLTMITTAPDGSSGAITYAIDDGERSLTQSSTIGVPGGDLSSFALGQVIPLENGNTLVNFGGTGVMREYTPDGTVVWEVETSSGSWFGNVTPFYDFDTGTHVTPSG